MSRSLLSLFGLIALIQIIFYLIAVSFRTDKVTDLAYGSTFAILAVRGYLQSTQEIIHLIMVIAVVVRGLRLSGYLFMRILNIGKDERFDTMRDSWKSFGKFRLLQTISIWIIFLPAFFVFGFDGVVGAHWSIVIGGVLWLGGFIIETVADHQKYRFKQLHPNRRVDIGLWKYARHPNYFGEMMVRWGVFVIASAVLVGWQWGSVVSPLFIMFLLLYVSGIPLLEKQHDKKYGDDPKYMEYKQRTHLLVPLPK